MTNSEDRFQLPLAQIERIMRNAGAEKMTENAVKTLRSSTHGLGEELARDAVKRAREEGRDTVELADIEYAISH